MTIVVWFIGLLTGLACYKMYTILKTKKLTFKWYHWLICVLWYCLGLFVIGFVGTSFAEGEIRAAGMATLIFGGVYIVITILLYRFLYSKKFKALKA